MGSPIGSLVEPWDRAFGKYELVAKLATGGMAEIFLARRSGAAGEPDELFVIKRVLPHLAEDERFIAMFRDEARIASRLEHRNVCKVFELGRVGETYFIAMEYLHGVAVSRLLLRASRAEQPLGLPLIAGMIHQCCVGLHHAHELVTLDGRPLDVVHRDVSPPNIFITEEGVVKLLDFGVAKARGASQKTRTGTVKGKNSYMSPEQILGKAVDRRSDLFALGIVMWESLTAERLFARDTDFLTFRAITDAEIPDVREKRPDVPEELCRTLYRALEAAPDDRYANCLEFGQAISEAMKEHGGVAGEQEISEFIKREFARDLASRQRLFRAATDAPEADEDGYEDIWLSAEAETKDAWPVSGAGAGEAGEEREGSDAEEESVPMKRIDAGVGALPDREVARRARGYGRWLIVAAAGLAVVGLLLFAGSFLAGDSSRDSASRRAARASGEASESPDRDGERARTSERRAVKGAGVRKGRGAREGEGATGDARAGAAGDGNEEERAGAQGESGAVESAGDEGESEGADKAGGEAEGEAEEEEKKRRPGFFSIDSSPWARIYVDGRELGVTPLFKKKLPAGRHRIKAVSATGEVKRFSVRVRPGKTATVPRLRWE